MDVNQSSLAFAGTAASANVQTQTSQRAAQEDRAVVQTATANNDAVSSTDVGNVSAAGDSGEGRSAPAAVESDPPADTTSEGENPRGNNVDISV